MLQKPIHHVNGENVDYSPCIAHGIRIFLCYCETLKYDSIVLFWFRIYHIKAALVCNTMAVGMWLSYHSAAATAITAVVVVVIAAVAAVNVFTKDIEWRENESRER